MTWSGSPRRIIERVIQACSYDLMLVREVSGRVVFVQSLANPWAAWYVGKRSMARINSHQAEAPHESLAQAEYAR